MNGFRFENPWFLLFGLAALIPFVVRWRRGGAEFPAFALVRQALSVSRRPWLLRLLTGCGLALLAVAMARPQFGRTIETRTQEGRDLILVIDLSYSMIVDDIIDRGQYHRRLTAVMEAARRFVRGRPNDRIGLVFFASRSLLSCPPTYDTHTLTDFLDRTETQQESLWRQNRYSDQQKGLVGDGTNLGLGMGSALRALHNPKSKGRAIIIITDGADSRDMPGWVDPLVAARHAHQLGVKLYGIGVGNPNGSRSIDPDAIGHVRRVPVSGNLLPDLGRLQEITALADGISFTANDAAALEDVFRRIDLLEPTPQEVTRREDFADHFLPFLAIGLACLALAVFSEPWLRGVA